MSQEFPMIKLGLRLEKLKFLTNKNFCSKSYYGPQLISSSCGHLSLVIVAMTHWYKPLIDGMNCMMAHSDQDPRVEKLHQEP